MVRIDPNRPPFMGVSLATLRRFRPTGAMTEEVVARLRAAGFEVKAVHRDLGRE